MGLKHLESLIPSQVDHNLLKGITHFCGLCVFERRLKEKGHCFGILLFLTRKTYLKCHLGDSERQRSLEYCSPQGHIESETTE